MQVVLLLGIVTLMVLSCFCIWLQVMSNKSMTSVRNHVCLRYRRDGDVCLLYIPVAYFKVVMYYPCFGRVCLVCRNFL